MVAEDFDLHRHMHGARYCLTFLRRLDMRGHRSVVGGSGETRRSWPGAVRDKGLTRVGSTSPLFPTSTPSLVTLSFFFLNSLPGAQDNPYVSVHIRQVGDRTQALGERLGAGPSVVAALTSARC